MDGQLTEKDTKMSTRFPKGVSGNPAGRPRDARNRLTRKVLEDILAHWNEPTPENPKIAKGRHALEAAWLDKPVDYVRAVLSVMPRELAIENVMSDMTDADLDELTVAIRDHLRTVRSGSDKDGDKDEDQSVH